MAVNSFEFNPESRIVQIEGPNKRGKSEAWRTLHLLNALANSGYPVPASSVTMGVVPNSHFISCKGRSGHGGSELERSIRGIEEQLQEVYNGDMVILDEFGDSTNAPTALEIAKRLLPQLIDRGCRVYVTSHHDALTSYISNGLKGISLMPNPAEKGIRRYELIPSDKEVDFKAEETLDDIGFTDKTVRKNLPNESRLSARRRDPERDDYLREDDDIPF
jgi:DNA mismatch repair ATPase MutS